MAFSMRLIPVVGVLVLQGCTSASMRVDVQVYKGPLSKELPIQVSEISGNLAATHGHLIAYLKEVSGLVDIAQQGCNIARTEERDLGLCRVEVKARKMMEQGYLLAQKTRETHERLENVIGQNCGGQCLEAPLMGLIALKPVLQNVASIGMAMKQAAIGAAYQLGVWQPKDNVVRIHLANAANLLAETSNQLSSRADALYKQIGGTPAGHLSQSVFLRDSSPTSFLNMYAWDGAMQPPLNEDATHFEREERADRVRALEHHFSDHYWSTINTVVASGEGKVGMALIKDDIGNWNLKNFESDPTDLIDAYKSVGIAALKAATEVVKQGALGPLSSTQKFLAIADQFNFGGKGEGASSLDGLVAALHASTAGSLKAVADEMRVKPKALNAMIEEKRGAVGNAQPKDIAGCTATASAEADKVIQESLLEAHRILGEPGVEGEFLMNAKSSARNAIKAEDAAEKAKVDAADAPTVCTVARNARLDVDKARLWLEAHRLEAERTQLPATAQSRVKALLDAHERSLLELARASLAKEDKTKVKAPTVSLPSLGTK